MTEAERQDLAIDVTRSTGLRFSLSEGRNAVGETLDFALADLDKNEGFSIRLQLGWRSLELFFHPGNYAAQLISQMGTAPLARRKAFSSLAQQSVAEGAVVSLMINGVHHDANAPDGWPDDWRSFSLSLRKSPIDLGTRESEAREVRQWINRFLAPLITLLPLEEQLDSTSEVTGYPEGALLRVEVNRYERDRRNRLLCLQAKGNACNVCGFDFHERYGELGRDFIHVHHITPAAALGAGYVINPVADLVPVCPNCHAMLHRRNPPLMIEELRALIAQGKAVAGS